MDFYAGRGNASMYDEYMALINGAFEVQNDETGFITMLPKLYKPEYDPCAQNYVVRDTDGLLKAAVGAYDGTFMVCGTAIKSRGIGNVCVAHDARSNGYMKLLMNMAVNGMISDGIDVSGLGGRRMRYRYFSYDVSSAEYRFNIDKPDLEHYFGKDFDPKLEICEITSPDAEELDAMQALFEAKAFYALRGPRVCFYDTLKNWRDRVFCAKKSGRVVGYSVGHANIKELVLEDESVLDEYILSYMAALELGGLHIALPYYQKRVASRLTQYAAGVSLGHSEQFTVLNFRNVAEAFLRLAATESELADGRAVILVHGRAGDETLDISVNRGNIEVNRVNAAAEYEFSHFEAMEALFAVTSGLREKLPAAVRSWLPVPLYIYSADSV